MENLGKKLMLGGSVAALLAGASTVAQAQEGQTESVTVSASRIQVQGYDQPTPVTVIGVEQLNRDAKVDLGDSIRELPAVGGRGDSPGNGSHSGNASQGDAGLDTVDLRALGVVRTLVLFDGQRVVSSNPNSGGPPAIGGVDLSTIPSTMIERVDVVTGGASAQWGSDAVAGVVNLVINKHFTGFKANAVFGNSSHNDHKSYKVEFAWGTDFLGGRAHTEFAANYTMSPDTFYNWNRKWWDHGNRALYPCSVVNGGAANALCHTPQGTYSNALTNGGLVTGSAAGLSTTRSINNFNANGTPNSALNTSNAAANTADAARIAAIQSIGGQFAGFGASPSTASNVLKNIQFVGPDARQIPFNTGFSNGTNCYSCSGNIDSTVANQSPSAVPYHNYNLFSYTSYKLTDSITASLMLNYGWNAENNIANNGRAQNYTIQIDNAFIPDTIRQQMISQGIQTLTLGSAAMGNLINHRQVSMYNLSQAVGQNYVQNYRQMMRGVFTLAGAYSLFGEDWSWEAYAQNSSVRERQWARLNTINTHINNAVDSVVVQASGPNSLGGGNAATAAQVRSILTAAGVPIPQVGSIACRSTLTQTLYGTFTASSGFQAVQPGGLAPGCAPLNLFGEGVTSQAALNYVAPGRQLDGVADQALYRINQQVYSVSTSGTLPWGLPAGKIAMALGFEDRLEQQRNQRDPLGLGASGVWESGNFSQFPDLNPATGTYGKGAYNVQEGFLELTIPVLKNQFVDSLEFNAAGRITSYSTSGMVETWKVGATSQINEDIKLRTSLSSDIRAPGIGELFSPILVSTQGQTYPPGTGGQSFQVRQLQAGNPLLQPEQATTVSGGIVLTPHWIENLQMSFDWYSITLHGGIFSPSSGLIFNQCAILKNPAYCQFVFFGQGPLNSSGFRTSELDGNGNNPSPLIGNLTFASINPGDFNGYYQGPVNANRETVSGLDFQIDYNHELLDGQMSWHIVGNYTDEKTRTTPDGITVDGAGAVSGDGALNPLNGFTTPKFHVTIADTYTEGDWSLTAQARIIGSARLTNNLLQNQSQFVSIDNNAVPAVIYGDFRGSYRFNDHIQLYGAIDNAFDAPPPNIPTIGGGGFSCQTYDCIGRAYRVGVRFDD